VRWEPWRTLRRNLQSQGQLKRRTRSFFLFVVLPAWLGPGLLDWYCHKRTHIEKPGNGGFPESLIHSMMFAEGGVPLVLSASFEMNPLIMSLMTGAAVVHEVTAMVDVRVAAKSRRHLSQWEQHIHSFLEVMPFWVVPLMVLLHEPTTQDWTFVRRSSALSKRDLLVVGAAVTAAGVLPYAEEMLRCVRHSRNLNSTSPRRAERVLSVLRGAPPQAEAQEPGATPSGRKQASGGVAANEAR
jgi:hypothetical protein